VRRPREVVQDVVKCSVEGVFTEELPELVTSLGNDIGQNLRNDQSHSLALQRRENRAQPLVLAIAASLLAACATERSDGAPCPPVVAYNPELPPLPTNSIRRFGHRADACRLPGDAGPSAGVPVT
jgi:hypothetical protein